MKRALAAAVGALLGVLFAVSAASIAARIGVVPPVPAYAGEDDFTLRFLWFLFLVCPAFGALGGWIALRRSAGAARYRALGAVVAATTIVFVTARLLAPAFAALETRQSADAAVVALFTVWSGLAWVATLVFWRSRRV